MDEAALVEMLKSGENEELATCESLDDDEIAKHICALTNTKGGTLIIGVRKLARPLPNGTWFELLGVPNMRSIEDQLSQIGYSLKPVVSIDQVIVSLTSRKNACCVLATVNRKLRDERTTTADGKAYLRFNRETVLAGVGVMPFHDFEAELGKQFNQVGDFAEDLASQYKLPDSQDDNPNVEVLDKTEADPSAELIERDGNNDIRESLPSNASGTSEAQVAPDDDAQESFVDSTPQAKALRKGIISEFDSLPRDKKLAFARTQLGTGLMQPEWEYNFHDSLNYSTRANLEQVARELAEFKRTNGRVHGNVNEYRREATTEEECLNLDTYTRVLSRFFASAKEDVCFGIFGHWGRGKTYLMKTVGKRLEDNHNYRVVRFSAWKYRTNPELWIYLYECIASLARKEHWFDARFAIPVRAAFSRFGLWGLTISLLVLAVALTPLLARFEYAISIIFWLGIGPVLYLLLIYTRLRSFAVTLKPYFLIPDHAGKLGLQATIGVDLRALLLGWMPQNTWMKPTQRTELCKHLRKNGKGFESLAYATMVIIVAVQPWFYSGTFPLGVFFAVVWTGLALGLPISALLRSSGPHRILLVVDDLDRCESKQMLEIIESIMLLLDDVEVQNRLQVVMLVEEEAVEYAISLKYQHYWRNLKNHSRLEKKRALIDENMQKLFLAYLRLGQLNTSEIQEVAESYLQVSRGFAYEVNFGVASPSEIPSRVESSQSEPENSSSNLDSNPNEDSSTPSSTLDDAKSENLQFKFGECEKHAIIEALRSEIVRNQSRWGPRAIRCFIHKYQLARELLVEIHSSNEVSPRELVEKLLTPSPKLQSLIEHTPYKGADYVVRQIK